MLHLQGSVQGSLRPVLDDVEHEHGRCLVIKQALLSPGGNVFTGPIELIVSILEEEVMELSFV